MEVARNLRFTEKTRGFMYRLTATVFLALFLSGPLWAEHTFDSPRATFEAYLKACEVGDYTAAESCYTKSSRELAQAQWKDQPARDPELLKEAYKSLSSLAFREEIVSPTRAILWPDNESVAPLLFRIQDKEQGWRMDYHFMSSYIKVDQNGWSWKNPKLFSIWKTRP